MATGQLHYLAIDENEPTGKPVALCKKISVKLSLHQPEEDLAVYRKSGLRALRQHRIVRIANEAIEQGGLLSYEDIAFMLTTSVVTVKRDMSHMRRRGIILYLSGHQFSVIEQRTRHSEGAIRRYIQEFARVALLHKKSFSVDQIRITTGFSHRLIGEYLKLAKHHSDSPHLKRILQLSKKEG